MVIYYLVAKTVMSLYIDVKSLQLTFIFVQARLAALSLYDSYSKWLCISEKAEVNLKY